MSDLYETDIALWAVRQADAIRRRASNEIDWDNVAEEIDDVGGSRRDEIENRLAVLCAHLLKWQFQAKRRSRSWAASIVEARNRIAKVIRGNPSLKNYPGTVLADAYNDGRRVAAVETGLNTLPAQCPWSIEQVLDHDFWPKT